MSKEKDPNEILEDFICSNCAQMGTIYANAYETWDREAQDSRFQEGPEWLCSECGTSSVCSIRLPRKTWGILDSLSHDPPKCRKATLADVREAFMDLQIPEHANCPTTTIKLLENAYRAAAIREDMPEQEIEDDLNAIKTFLDL